MNNTKLMSINDLLNLFEDSVTASEVMEARAIAQVTTSIIKERKRLGLDQKEFANKLGVSQSLISRWENGNSNFTIKSLSEIATKLDMCLDVKIRRKIEIKQIDMYEINNYVKQKSYLPKNHYSNEKVYNGNNFVCENYGRESNKKKILENYI